MPGWGTQEPLSTYLLYLLSWSAPQIPKESSILGVTFWLARTMDNSQGMPQFRHLQNRANIPT